MSEEQPLRSEEFDQPGKIEFAPIEFDEGDPQLLASAISIALVSGTDIVATLRNAEAMYEHMEPIMRIQLVESVALACAEHPDALLSQMDFWNSFGEAPASRFYTALLERIEGLNPEQFAGVIARAKIMRYGYTWKRFSDEAGAVQHLPGDVDAYLSQAAENDPDAVRMYSRMRYEQHRDGYNRAKPYLDAVAPLDFNADHDKIIALGVEHLEAFEALMEAFMFLQKAVQIDQEHGHDMFCLCTDDRIVDISLDARFISAKDALGQFQKFERAFEQIDTTQLKAGTPALVRKFLSNAVFHEAKALRMLGREEEAVAADARYKELRPAV